MVGDAVRPLDVGPVALEQVEEAGRDQHGPQREPDGGLEAVASGLARRNSFIPAWSIRRSEAMSAPGSTARLSSI